MATLQTTENRPAGSSHADGKAYFETSTNKFIVWDANDGEWIELNSDGLGSAHQNRWGVTAGSGDVLHISPPEINNPILLDKAGGYALSAWVNYTKTVGSGFITKATTTDYFGFYNHNIARFNGLGGYKDVVMPSGTTTGWHHHVMNYDGGSTVTYYVDGVYQGSASKDLKDMPVDTVFNNGSFHFDGGTISDLALFNTALSDGGVDIGNAAGGDVASLRDNGRPVKLTDLDLDLTAWWRMGDDPNDSPTDGSGAEYITDSSGNGLYLSQETVTSRPVFYELPNDNVHRI